MYQNENKNGADNARNLKFKNKNTFQTLESEDVYSGVQIKEGFLWTFGRNKDGELGLGSTEDSLLP